MIKRYNISLFCYWHTSYNLIIDIKLTEYVKTVTIIPFCGHLCSGYLRKEATVILIVLPFVYLTSLSI